MGIKHGMFGTPEYNSWRAMKDRCCRKAHPHYNGYGGRGITVEYRSFDEFYADVGDRPSENHSIDRIDNDGNYAKGNCRWATRGEQRRNSRNVRVIRHNGQEMCIKDWSVKTGISPQTIGKRLRQGWDVSRVLDNKDYRSGRRRSQ
jgi:hypothetical protein